MTEAPSNPGSGGFDWVRFWVRFGCGAVFGVPFGFGFWIQMCRPLDSQNFGSWIPRKVTELLNLEHAINTGGAGLVVVLIFAALFGLGVALWRSRSRHWG